MLLRYVQLVHFLCLLIHLYTGVAGDLDRKSPGHWWMSLYRRTVFLILLASSLSFPRLQFISDGYASHLAHLEYSQRSRPAKTGSTRVTLRKGSFGLGASGDFLRKRNHLLRTISSQPAPSATSSGHGSRPERAQSQSEFDRERSDRAQRSMSIAAGCFGRAGKMEGGTLSPK